MNKLRALLCKLPKWAGGGHRWSKPYFYDFDAFDPSLHSDAKRRKCRRFGAVREVKRRKVKHD